LFLALEHFQILLEWAIRNEVSKPITEGGILLIGGYVLAGHLEVAI
jgi:hypothetical protein